MSTRQLRRLQVLSAEGAAASDESSADDLPNTMLRPKAGKARRRRDEPKLTSAVEEQGNDDAPAPSNRTSSLKDTAKPSPTVAAKGGKATSKATTKKKKSGGAPAEDDFEADLQRFAREQLGQGQGGSRGAPQAETPEVHAKASVTNSNATPSPSSSVSKRRTRRKKTDDDDDDEEDAEFEATLQQYAKQHGDEEGPAEGASSNADSGSAASGGAASLASLLTADKQCLDPRNERMKSFGAGSVESFKPQHPQVPKFRPSALATADPNRWYPFDTLGFRLDEVPKAPGVALPRDLTLYTLNTSDARFQEASKALHGAVMSGSVEALYDVMQRYPYHVPTLVQLHRTLATMGDNGQAQQVLDMALYAAGITLAPVLGRPGTAAMLVPSPAASLVTELLRFGLHSAMRKGCAKTALEVCKAALSLDVSDPQRLLLVTDYVAIRASAWSWAVAVYLAAVNASHPSAQSPIPFMPSWALTAALGAHMRAHAAASDKRGGGKPRGGPGATSASAAYELTGAALAKAADGGNALLDDAILRFPEAVVGVADRAGVKLDSGAWPVFVNRVLPALNARSSPTHIQRHLASLYAERAADLWKMPNASAFLTAGIERAVAAFNNDRDAFFDRQTDLTVGWNQEEGDALLAPYRAANVDELLGNFTGPAIPRELLQEGPTEQEQLAAFAARERATLNDAQRLLLDRFEAAFGPLPADLPLDQRVAVYEDMLQDRLATMGADHTAVGLFLRTLLPWNTPREMALQAAFREAGREDPAVTRRREERERVAANDLEFVEYDSDEEDDDHEHVD
jgi:hypothetical protein